MSLLVFAEKSTLRRLDAEGDGEAAPDLRRGQTAMIRGIRVFDEGGEEVDRYRPGMSLVVEVEWEVAERALAAGFGGSGAGDDDDDAPISGSRAERYQVMLHVDAEVLREDGPVGGRSELEDGTRVCAETLRRVACDCGLVAVGHDGQALNIGRRARSMPPAILRALMLRDRGCAFPGCPHTRFLHAHHLQHWLHGGATSLDHLVMLCSFHHHLVHEGGWRVSAAADGSFLFHPPEGKPLAAVPPREPVAGAVAWLRNWAQENDLHLGPETNRPQWDGTSPDYALAVEVLLEGG